MAFLCYLLLSIKFLAPLSRPFSTKCTQYLYAVAVFLLVFFYVILVTNSICYADFLFFGYVDHFCACGLFELLSFTKKILNTSRKIIQSVSTLLEHLFFAIVSKLTQSRDQNCRFECFEYMFS